MNEYKEMYYKLFNKLTSIIEELKEVQQATEEYYLKQTKSPPTVIKLPKKK